MEPNTYKVKSGDTLNKIAKNLGVSMDQISGYKSGNKDLIYAGETLNIGNNKNKPVNAQIYTDEVSTQLQDEKPSFNTTSLKTNLSDIETKRNTSYEGLKGLTTNTFNSEYDTRKMNEKKGRIKMYDDEIGALKTERDEAMNKIRKNPGLSAAQMQGDMKKIADFQNAKINNLVEARNGAATEYNNELGEIDKIVDRLLSDKMTEFQFYDSEMKRYSGMIGDYEKQLLESLREEKQDDQFDRQLAQALQIATMNKNKGGSGDEDWEMIRDPNTNLPLYWYNPETMEVRMSEDDEDESGGSVTSYDDVGEAKAPKTGFLSKSWFNNLFSKKK